MKKVFMLLVACVLLTLSTVSCDRSNGWVDLGLPSGTLWAECNIGATSPEQYGNYYAWGETQPKTVYDWSTYRYCGDNHLMNKYCTNSDYGTVDNLSALLPDDDVATVEIGKEVHIPTKEQWQELLNNTKSEWTEYKGVYGRRFTGVNGKSLFLPAAGDRSGSELDGAGTGGYYWSSSLYTDYPRSAWYCYFNSDGQGVVSNYRYYGRSVRSVRASQN